MSSEHNHHIEEQFNERKLHPLTLIYRLITNLPTIAIPFYFAFVQGSAENWIFIALSALALLFTVPMIILNYYYFSFTISPNEIFIRSGVFSRQQRNIPVRRIQNINIEQNFLQNILGLAKVTMETAGNAEMEGQLEYVSKSDAHEIKQSIREYQYKVQYSAGAADKSDEPTTSEPDTDSEFADEIPPETADKILYQMSLREIVIHGMTRFRPVLLIFVFWLFSMAQQFYIMPQFDEISSESINQLEMIITGQNIALFIVFAAFALLIGTWILDILLTFNQFYGFKLFDADGKLLTDYGLLTKRHSTIPLKKMQSLTILTNPIKRKFDYFSLIIQTAGLGAHRNGSADIAIPLAKQSQLLGIAKHIRKIDIPENMNKVSKKTIRRTIFRAVMFLIPFLIALYFIYTPGLWASLVILPLIFLHAYLRWKFMAYAMSDNNIIVKSGYLRQKLTIIPVNKLQTLSIEASFFQRRLGLATVHVDTAAQSTISYFSENSVVDIEKDDAEKLMKSINSKFRQINNLPEKLDDDYRNN